MAYATLVRLYGGRLLAVARRYFPGSEDAQDAVQEAFLSAFQALGRFEENALSPAERAAFDAHLADCQCCGTYLATYRETVALEREAFADLDARVPESVPEDLVKGILAARRAIG